MKTIRVHEDIFDLDTEIVVERHGNLQTDILAVVVIHELEIMVGEIRINSVDFEPAVVIVVDLHGFSDRRDDPILLDASLGIMAHLRPAIILCRRRRKNFDHEVRSTINGVFVENRPVADNHGVRDVVVLVIEIHIRAISKSDASLPFEMGV